MYCEVKITSSDGGTQIVDSTLEELEQTWATLTRLEHPWTS